MKSTEVLELLLSSDPKDRQRGSEILRQLKLRSELLEIEVLVRAAKVEALETQFCEILARLLRSESPEISGSALELLLLRSEEESRELRLLCRGHIDEYLSSPQTHRFQILMNMRFAWKQLAPLQRRGATRFIGNYQLREALSLLLDNFRQDDVSLQLLTLEVFRRLQDGRANGQIRALLHRNPEEKLLTKAIEVLGVTGSIWDFWALRRFVRAPYPSTRVAALEALHRLMGTLSYPVLKKSLEEEGPLVQARILELLVRTPTKRGLRLLLQLWPQHSGVALGTKIEQGLRDIPNQLKLPELRKLFPQVPLRIKLKLIALMDVEVSEGNLAFYQQILRQRSEDPRVLIAAMEGMSHYPQLADINLLRPYLEDKESELYYPALAAFLRLDAEDPTPELEAAIDHHTPHERHLHQLILSSLVEKHRLKKLSLYLQSYVLVMLRSERAENRLLASEVIQKFHLDFELGGVIELFGREASPMVRSSGMRALAGIFSSSPMSFMASKPQPWLLADQEFQRAVRPTHSCLLALFENRSRETLSWVQARHPQETWRCTLELLREGHLRGEQLEWIELTPSYDEFEEILEREDLTDLVVNRLFAFAARSPDPRFGEFLLGEFARRREAQLIPFITTFINGIP